MNDFSFWYNLLLSPEFKRALSNVAIGCAMLAFGAIVISLVFLKAGQSYRGTSAQDARWSMLFATWRDSMIITLLFVAQGFVWRFADFNGLAHIDGTYGGWESLLQPTLLFITDIFIFVVAALRIVLLTRWLASTNAASAAVEG